MVSNSIGGFNQSTNTSKMLRKQMNMMNHNYRLCKQMTLFMIQQKKPKPFAPCSYCSVMYHQQLKSCQDRVILQTPMKNQLITMKKTYKQRLVLLRSVSTSRKMTLTFLVLYSTSKSQISTSISPALSINLIYL